MAPSSAADAEGPNVLLILTDDQRASGTMRFMPSTRREFADGVRFKRAFVTTPACCPSRASIYSGKFSHNHGVLNNGQGRNFDASESWPAVLDRAGYFTGITGKWLNRVPASEAPFDYSRGAFSYDTPDEPDRVRRATTQFLLRAEADDQRPWAFVLATYAPHSPYLSRPQVRRYRRTPYEPAWEYDLSDKKPGLGKSVTLRRVRRIVNGQRRELVALDEQLASVYRVIRQLGERRRTLMFFLSDNGYFWGEHDLTGKIKPYLEAVRVPLYVRGPGIEPGVLNKIAANIDLAPTIYEATEIEPGYDVDGLDLFGPSREWLLTEGSNLAWRGYLDGRRHYIRWADGWVESYDLLDDPLEHQASWLPDPRLDARLLGAGRCSGAACR